MTRTSLPRFRIQIASAVRFEARRRTDSRGSGSWVNCAGYFVDAPNRFARALIVSGAPNPVGAGVLRGIGR